MTDSEAYVPKFKDYKDGESIPSVDPEDIRHTWEYDRTHSPVGTDGCHWLHARRAVCRPGADVDDVSRRCEMIERLTRYSDGQLLVPWKHGDELDDAVFRIAATFPLQYLRHREYSIPGDYLWDFDANAFIQRLIEETGISHTWEPVLIKVSEGGRCWHMSEQPGPAETASKRRARELLWILWRRCASDLVTHFGERHPEVIAKFYADFVIDNVDLVRQVENSFGTAGAPPMEVLQELEQRAAKWNPWDR